MLLIFISLAVSTVALFSCVFTELVYDALAPWKKKKIRMSCNLFIFIFFVSLILNVIVFSYNRSKQSLIQQTKLNAFYRFLSFLEFLCLF